MRTVLQGLDVSYIMDDVLCHSLDWPFQISALSHFLASLKELELRFKPPRREAAFPPLQYLGLMARKGVMSLLREEVQISRDRPESSLITRLRSFLGSARPYERLATQHGHGKDACPAELMSLWPLPLHEGAGATTLRLASL